jgi:hypothetical protein
LFACAGPISAEDPIVAPEPEIDAAAADAPVAEQAPADPAPVPPLPSSGSAPGLDSLLTLPGDRTYTVERRAGLTSGEWRAKFDRARSDLVEAEVALEDAELRMDEAAKRGAWKVAPPIPGQDQGAPGETSLDFKTRQEIRRHRAEIERLESRMKDLEIEANLAAVPADWRG